MKPFILIKQAEIAHVLHLDNIVYCKSERNYSKIHLLTGESISYSRPLSKLCEQLNGYFVKVSKSLVVGKHHIKQVNKKEKTLIMCNGDAMPYTIKTTDLLRILEFNPEGDKSNS